MKKLLTILCLLILVSCSPPPEPLPQYSEENFNFRNDIPYLINSSEPFTGIIGSNSEVFLGKKVKHEYNNGKKEGLHQVLYKNG